MNRELEEALKELALEIAQAYATIKHQRAVMQQALKALQRSETVVPYEGFGLSHREAERNHQAAITALREALEET